MRDRLAAGGRALQFAGIGIVALALAAAIAAHFSLGSSRSASIFVGVFTSEPVALPALRVTGSGTRVRLEIRALQPDRRVDGQAIFAGTTRCVDAADRVLGAPLGAHYYRIAFSLYGKPFAATCDLREGAIVHNANGNDLHAGMLEPYKVAYYVRRGFEPAHGLRVDLSDNALAGVTFDAGLAQPPRAGSPASPMVRYLSRYGEDFAPALVAHWR